MASFIQGYDEERFVTAVNRNFLCLICFSVLKDPVFCPRNQHCFCRGCITKHLENSQRCPTCNDELTEETLTEPPRMVKEYLNELNIHCVYHNRGCQEILQLQYLDSHEATCGYTPAVCTNQGCGETLNQRDIIHHESEVCEFRKLKCHSCEEIKTTLTNVEERILNTETVDTEIKNAQRNMATHMGNMETRIANLEVKMARVETNMLNLNTNMTNMKSNIEGKLDVVNNDVRGLQTALIDAFNEMKDVLVKMDKKIEENTRKVRNKPSGDKENIIVAGGYGTASVEMFNWRQRTWSPLQSMPQTRSGATSFVYNNHLTIAGGFCAGPAGVDNMIRMNIYPNPDLSTNWTNWPVKLSAELVYHSSVLYKDHLIVTGGSDGNVTSDCIHDVQLVPPYTVKTLSRMTKPRRNHCTEIFDDSLLVLGGRTTGRYQDSLDSVLLYDIKKNECKQLSPLPYKVSQMAMVRWEDNIVIIGGKDKHGNELNTVIIYNVKTGQSHMLPPMKCRRYKCTAVVIENNIVVLGGWGEHFQQLRSVEAFNFESYTWEELPEMSQGRTNHTAVVV